MRGKGIISPLFNTFMRLERTARREIDAQGPIDLTTLLISKGEKRNCVLRALN